MLGTWIDVADPQRLLRLEARRMSRVEGGRLVEIARIDHYEPERIVLDQPVLPRRVDAAVSDGDLVVTDEIGGGARVYRKAWVSPRAFTVRPLRIPRVRTVPPERLGEVAAEATRRFTESKSARRSSPPDPAAAAALDAANAEWLRAAIAEVGWIDSTRHGLDAAEAAASIAQHAADFDLMAAALEQLDDEAVLTPRLKFWRALLHDRYHLLIGEPQRYGSQYRKLEDGTIGLLPVEDLVAAEKFWREEMGFSKGLAEYLGVQGLADVRLLLFRE